MTAYEDSKRSFKPAGAPLPTGEACAQAGFEFIPMVMEAHGGGWGAGARAVIGSLARCVAVARNIDPASASLDFAQPISASLLRFNSRALPSLFFTSAPATLPPLVYLLLSLLNPTYHYNSL
mgnify:CR=1 FL=1